MECASTSTAPTRSVSLPTRFQPTGVEAELQKLRNRVETTQFIHKTDTVCTSLCGLSSLYGFLKDELSIPANQQAIAGLRMDNCTEEALDRFVRLLDVCGAIKEALVLAKESLQQLQLALRRKKIDVACDVDSYIQSRKKVKKGVGSCLKNLRKQLGVGNEKLLCPVPIIQAIIDVQLISNSVLTSLLLSLSSSGSENTGWWSLISRTKQLHKKKVAAEDEQLLENAGELESVDASVSKLRCRLLSKDGDTKDMVDSLARQTEASEIRMGKIEDLIKSLSKGLIQNRVCLLNILSTF